MNSLIEQFTAFLCVRTTETANKDGAWLREISSCCCLTTAGKPRKLNKIYIPFLPSLYYNGTYFPTYVNVEKARVTAAHGASSLLSFCLPRSPLPSPLLVVCLSSYVFDIDIASPLVVWEEEEEMKEWRGRFARVGVVANGLFIHASDQRVRGGVWCGSPADPAPLCPMLQKLYSMVLGSKKTEVA